MRPKVAVVGGTCAFAGARERLARATSCPNRSVVGNSCESEGKRPSGDAGEEMALCVASQIVGLDVANVPLVNVARCDVSCGDEVSEPLRGIGIDLVVVGGQAHSRVVSGYFFRFRISSASWARTSLVCRST